jgi:hypothetical protein
LFLCCYIFSGKNKTGKSCADALAKRHARKNGPQSYIYIMQVIRSLSFSGIETFVFRLPITGIMYSGLRQIAALPPRRDPGTKTAKKQSKGMQAPHWPTRSKKARVYKQPVMVI